VRTAKEFGIQRLVSGWVIFFGGLTLILWLHTFSDRAPHRLILPLLLLLWVALIVCIWDACKKFTPRLRIICIFAQVVVALIACMLLVSHFLNHST
jgi:hypothetical protein